jgi:hypothetical protein
MERRQLTISIVVVSMVTLMFTTFSLPQQQAQACKLKSEITLEDMGLFMDNVTINEKGEVVGFKQDFSHATVPCETVGDALDSGYTMDEIMQDQLKQTPLS